MSINKRLIGTGGAGLFPIRSLVVGGGGCGGSGGNAYNNPSADDLWAGGGGGAGGMIDSLEYPGSQGDVIPVIVGPRGQLEGPYDGGDSSFGEIIAYGGGRGAGYSRNGVAQNGGSGGGGTHKYAGGLGTAGQGNDGGPQRGALRIYNQTNFYVAGGGGGGAGQPGDILGPGGDGLPSDIISEGTSTTAGVGYRLGGQVYFAGGGAGWMVEHLGPNNFSISLGGGGNIGPSPQWQTTPFTGSGGGAQNNGTSTSYNPWRAGASGVVILRMETSLYSGTYTGTPEIYTEGSDTILIFKADGSYTL